MAINVALFFCVADRAEFVGCIIIGPFVVAAIIVWQIGSSSFTQNWFQTSNFLNASAATKPSVTDLAPRYTIFLTSSSIAWLGKLFAGRRVPSPLEKTICDCILRRTTPTLRMTPWVVYQESWRSRNPKAIQFENKKQGVSEIEGQAKPKGETQRRFTSRTRSTYRWMPKVNKKRGRYMLSISLCVMRNLCLCVYVFFMRVSMCPCVRESYVSLCCFCVLQASL